MDGYAFIFSEVRKEVRNWLQQPINFSEEKSRLAIFTAIALFAIGLATLCYFYGTKFDDFMPGYGRFWAYGLWGLTGGAVLCTVVAYIARAILSRAHQKVRKSTPIVCRTVYERGDSEPIFKAFFPNLSWNDLKDFPIYLIGDTGLFDKHKVLKDYFHVNNSNILRGKQCGRPFIGIRLAIHCNDKPKERVLLIAPDLSGMWYVHGLAASISEDEDVWGLATLNEDTPASQEFIDWLVDIINGRKRKLLSLDLQGDISLKKAKFIEKPNAPMVSLFPTGSSSD